MNPYERRIQRFPGPCRLEYVNKEGETERVPLHYQNVLFWWFAAGTKLCQKVSSAERAKEMVIEAEKKGIGAFASAPIPCNNNQHGVFIVAAAGETEWIWRRYYNELKAAHDSVFDLDGVKTLSGKPLVPLNTEDKKDMCLACEVSFPLSNGCYTDKTYTYKCKKFHLKGELVTVKVFKGEDFELKNVKIVETFVTNERALIAFAKSLGREDIASLYCEQAIEL